MLANLGFKEAIVLATIGLAVLFSGLIQYRTDPIIGDSILPGLWSRCLLPLSLVLIIVLAVSSLVLDGPRGTSWFILQAATAVVLWLLSLTGRHRLVLICCCAGLVAITTFAIVQAQGIGVITEDQWRDQAANYDSLVRGNLDRARGVMGGYYSAIPALAILMPFISTVTGLDLFSSYVVVTPIFTFIAALALMILAERVAGFAGAPALVAIMILSTPRLDLWLLVHQNASLVLTVIVLLLLQRIYLSKDHRWSHGASVCLILLVFTVNAVHPSGTIAVFLFSIASLLVARIRLSSPLSLVGEVRLRWVLLSLATVVSAYWLFTNLVYFLGQNYLRAFALQFFTLHPYRVSMNVVLGNRLTAFAWAIPVALTLAYMFRVGVQLVQKHFRGRGTVDPLFSASYGAVALTTLVAAFAAWSVRGSEGSFERYLSVPAYLLLIFPSVAACGAITMRGRLPVVALSFVLLGGLFAAAHSIEWAPDVNEVEAGSATPADFEVARSLVGILPANGRLAAMKQFGSPLQYEYYIRGATWDSYDSREAPEYALDVGLNRNVRGAITSPPVSPGNHPTFVIVEASLLRGETLPAGTDLIYWGGRAAVLVPHA